MGGLEGLIGPLMSAVGDLIVDAVSDYNAGKAKQARTKLERFTALARATLKEDRAEAERILRDRFVGDAKPVDIYDELGIKPDSSHGADSPTSD